MDKILKYLSEIFLGLVNLNVASPKSPQYQLENIHE